MKIDPHKNERRFRYWQEKTKEGIPGLTPENSRVVKTFVRDMELGMNVSHASKKGPRSFIRLNSLASKITWVARNLQDLCSIDEMTKVTEEQIVELFRDMSGGTVLRKNGQRYEAPGYYVEVFKTFWHWHMLVERKKGNIVQDITEYLDKRHRKPKWVYITEEQVSRLCNNASFKYKVLMFFLYDSGIRSPTELVNVRVSDLSADFKQLTIREETSKTFGRKLNLMLCSALLGDCIQEKGLASHDQLFKISPPVVNRYLKRLAERVLGTGVSPAGGKYSDLTLYDFRHSSACYWIQRYKSESALKYRFGWKKSEMIFYYTDFLGLKDNISQEDMLVDVTKTEIEQKLAKADSDKRRMEDEIDSLRRQMKEILELTKRLVDKAA